ncbi:MAG TPA: PIN domain-containing protein [Solirubrobacterales bacterium]
MIVLDASVLIAHLDDRDIHHEAATRLLGESGGEPLGASSVTLAETLVAPARAGRLEEARIILARLGVADLGIGEDAPARLAELRATTGVKLPDCCVLGVAEEYEARIASFDGRLLDAAQELGLRTID